jgi:tRNA(adenine34) deaminase
MLRNGAGDLGTWQRSLDEFVPVVDHAHVTYAVRACRLALEAAHAGTYGVGAVLYDADGQVLVEGRNRVHDGGFRSDLHAEMVVMNEYESTRRPGARARHCTLVASLEPCPMCMTRLIVAGVGAVLYVSPDSIGGMVRRRHDLPPTFRAIMQGEGQTWASAECSDELRSIALNVWVESRRSLGHWFPGDPSPQPAENGRRAAS